ncbi:hypothetical protein EUX98_g5397 [Antrodiella citrinella]|uniref:Peroxisome membrane anchor protein Pex14p N-terminal domain-containing protein n=1 Tax=Antrodiella citrinella TaxID=2447956 RepID=A0A4S4MRV4_9APHY|nr:hypothetical protein EUX98_g5397 [Antrodiella citrinella]
MDVSHILAAHASKQQATAVDKEVPLDVDTGLLTVTDLNPIDAETYATDLEGYLMSTARDGAQALINSLWALPATDSPDGPVAKLPAPTTHLPRAKPLPKPKPPTKWEKFAKAKGISHTVKDKRVWDEEKQEWVNRWGWKGQNKEKEVQWLTEVKANADIDHDPRKVARDERKAKIAKNERQHQQNLARSQSDQGAASTSAPPTAGREFQSQRKTEIGRTLAVTRTSTASMGKFDKKLDGEKKLKGIKRKFDPAEVSATSEKSNNLAILSKLDREPHAKKSRSEPVSEVLNVRKAVRGATRGADGAALRREVSSGDREPAQPVASSSQLDAPAPAPAPNPEAQFTLETSQAQAPNDGDRVQLIERARTFLYSPQVRYEDNAAKYRFLAEKGLNDVEIHGLLNELQETFAVLPAPEPFKEGPRFRDCHSLESVLAVTDNVADIPPLSLLRCAFEELDVAEGEKENSGMTAEVLFGTLEAKCPWIGSDEGAEYAGRIWDCLNTTTPLFHQADTTWTYTAASPPAPTPLYTSLQSLQTALPLPQSIYKPKYQHTLQALSDFTGYIATQTYAAPAMFRLGVSGPGSGGVLSPEAEEARREIRALKGLVLNRCVFRLSVSAVVHALTFAET